jgi:hypothetical protein
MTDSASWVRVLVDLTTWVTPENLMHYLSKKNGIWQKITMSVIYALAVRNQTR